MAADDLADVHRTVGVLDQDVGAAVAIEVLETDREIAKIVSSNPSVEALKCSSVGGARSARCLDHRPPLATTSWLLALT